MALPLMAAAKLAPLAAKAAPAIRAIAASRSGAFISGTYDRTSRGRGAGSFLGSIPSATRWQALSSGIGTYDGEGAIRFSVGPAWTHKGAAYGVQGVGTSEFTEKTVSYGEGDLRGTSRTTGVHNPQPFPDNTVPSGWNALGSSDPVPGGWNSVTSSPRQTPTTNSQGSRTVDMDANPWQQKQQRTGNDQGFAPLFSDSHERGPSPTTNAGKPLLGRRR